MATSVVRAFRAQRPEIELEVIGRGVTSELFPGLLPPDACHRLDSTPPASLKGRFDLGILIPDSFSSAWHLFKIGLPALGRRGDWRGWMLRYPRPSRRRPPSRHLVEEWDELFAPLGVKPSARAPRIELTSEELCRGRERLRSAAGPPPAVALCPGAAFGPAKRWPAESYARLAAELRASGIRCVANGATAEEALLAPVAEAAGTPPLIGLPVREWASVLAASTVVVANDSGASHVAAACGSRVLALFGSTDPVWSRPLGDGNRVLTLRLTCSPCFQRECPLGHLNCLKHMTVESVKREVLAMTAGPAEVH